MAYVSDDLTHFVGRHLRSDEEEQYETFLSILRSGRLLPGGKEVSGEAMWASFGGTSLCAETMFLPNVVCFSDIPEGDLGLHMSKYGRFGIAFAKKWLIPRGVNPVFYLAVGEGSVSLGEGEGRMPRGDYFNQEVEAIYEALFDYEERVDEHGSLSSEGCEGLFSSLHHSAHFFLRYHVFSFIKCFDSSLPKNDPQNFYMEREWRVHGSIEFQLADVSLLIVPPEFRERLRRDLPGYTGPVLSAS